MYVFHRVWTYAYIPDMITINKVINISFLSKRFLASFSFFDENTYRQVLCCTADLQNLFTLYNWNFILIEQQFPISFSSHFLKLPKLITMHRNTVRMQFPKPTSHLFLLTDFLLVHWPLFISTNTSNPFLHQNL